MKINSNYYWSRFLSFQILTFKVSQLVGSKAMLIVLSTSLAMADCFQFHSNAVGKWNDGCLNSPYMYVRGISWKKTGKTLLNISIYFHPCFILWWILKKIWLGIAVKKWPCTHPVIPNVKWQNRILSYPYKERFHVQYALTLNEKEIQLKLYGN